MSKYHRDYVWKEGIPYGIEAVEPTAAVAYKIAMDPYRKRIAIEKYAFGQFENIIYDSALLDFRHLKPAEQTAWQKVTLVDEDQRIVAAIYNQDDRLILIETYTFEKAFCRGCLSKSGHGIALSIQKMYYRTLGDAFDGVILFDVNEHPVMFKRYQIEKSSGEFGELIEELWDGGQIPTMMSPLTAH
jgi:hypothetical protein